MKTNGSSIFQWEGEQQIPKSEFTGKKLSIISDDGAQTAGTLDVLTASGKPKAFAWFARYIGLKGGKDRWIVTSGALTSSAHARAKDSARSQFAKDKVSDFSIRMFISDRLQEFRHKKNGSNNGSSDDVAQEQSVSPTILADVSEIQVFQGQPREEFDEGIEMADSMAQEGQLQDIIVTPVQGAPGKKWELVDGERRLRAAILAGTKRVWVKVRHYKDKADQYWSSFVSNLQRADHTPLEYSDAVAKAFAIGKTLQEICRATGRKEMWVRQAYQLQKLAPSLRLLLRRNIPKNSQMRIGVARVLSKIPNQDVQRAIWEEARKQQTPGLIKLKVDQLAFPHLMKSPNRGRKPKPSDRAARAIRILRTGETDTAFLETLSEEDIRIFLGKNPKGSCAEAVKALNALMAAFDRFKRKMLKVSHEKASS